MLWRPMVCTTCPAKRRQKNRRGSCLSAILPCKPLSVSRTLALDLDKRQRLPVSIKSDLDSTLLCLCSSNAGSPQPERSAASSMGFTRTSQPSQSRLPSFSSLRGKAGGNAHTAQTAQRSAMSFGRKGRAAFIREPTPVSLSPLDLLTPAAAGAMHQPMQIPVQAVCMLEVMSPALQKIAS